MKPNHELSGIEVLRFLCAFGVLIWHYQHFFFAGEWDSMVGEALRPSLPLYRYLSFFYNNGSLAVPFFWVISGFIFYWQYADSIFNRTVVFSDFIIRRFSRLYPLHLATLMFVAAAQYAYFLSHGTTFIYAWNKPIWFASQLLFASNWFKRQPLTFNGPIWSVSIEILIYLSFFVIARRFRPSAWVIASFAAMFAVCFNFLNTFINPQVFSCGMYFFAGGVAQRLAAHRTALPVAGCLTLGAALSIGILGVNGPSILFLAMGVVVVSATPGEVGNALRPVAFLGNATYASYLLHFPIQLAIVLTVDAFGIKRDIFYSPFVLVGFLSIVIGLSLLVHRYFEMPAQSAIRMTAKASLARLKGMAATSHSVE
jgi:peptidoglycan/LPS O-acetylase OafA/YrhL